MPDTAFHETGKLLAIHNYNICDHAMKRNNLMGNRGETIGATLKMLFFETAEFLHVDGYIVL